MTDSAKVHWAAVRAAFSADEQARQLDAAALTAEQRVLLGLEMGAAAPYVPETDEELKRLGLEKAELHFLHQRLKEKRASRAR